MPDAVGHFVAAGVDGGQRRPRLGVHRDEVIDHRLEKTIGRRQADVDDVVIPHLHRPIFRLIVRIVQQKSGSLFILALRHQPGVAGLHGFDGRPRVARHVDLRDHLDVAVVGVAEEVDILRPRVGAAAVRVVGVRPGAEGRHEVVPFVEGVPAPSAHLGEFG